MGEDSTNETRRFFCGGVGDSTVEAGGGSVDDASDLLLFFLDGNVVYSSVEYFAWGKFAWVCTSKSLGLVWAADAPEPNTTVTCTAATSSANSQKASKSSSTKFTVS